MPRFLQRFTFVLVLVVLAVAGQAATANAATYGPFGYRPSTPYFDATDSNGRFTGQITYGSTNTLAWSFRLAPNLVGLATGPANVDADIYVQGQRVTSYHYHKVEVAGYFFHSSYRGTHPLANWALVFRVVFPIRGGTATVNGSHAFVVFLSG